MLEPAFGSGADQTEIMLTVGAAVAESRQAYERYRFLVTENNPVKDEMLKYFGGRVADTMGIAGNAQVSSAATLCANAVIPAIKAIMAGDEPPVAVVSTASPATDTTSTPPPLPTTPGPQGPAGTEIKLVSVMSPSPEKKWKLGGGCILDFDKIFPRRTCNKPQTDEPSC